MKIAVIGVQGDVIEHINHLNSALNELNTNGNIIWARTKNDLKNIDGIVIPGGESTTIKKLLIQTGIDKELKKLSQKNTPILATCAGTILVSKDHLNLIDIKVDRNAYGRQKNSFEAEISTDVGKTKGIFIRAPIIIEVFGKAKVFATHNEKTVGAKQNNILALTFHPELSDDTMIHKYFINSIQQNS